MESTASIVEKAASAGKYATEKMKTATWEDENDISGAEIEEIVKNVKAFTKTKEEFLRKVTGWKNIRQDTIDELNSIAEECDSLKKGCNISNVTGSSVGTAGGLLALGGILLAPFTAGTSLSLTLAGAGVGATGATVNITTSLVESSEMKKKCETAQFILKRDEEETKAMSAVIDKLMVYVDALSSLQKKIDRICKLEIASIVLDGTSLAAKSVTTAVDITRGVKALQIIRSFSAAELTVLKECPKMMRNLKAFKGTALAAGKVATFLAVASLGFSIYEIVTYSCDIHNGSKSEAGTKLRENAGNLKQQKNMVCELENNLKTK